MDSVYRLVIHRPRPILTVIFLLTVFFAYHARHISIDSSVASILPQDDLDKRYYDEVRLLFGSDDIAIVGLIADNIYTPQVLQKIQHLTDELRKVPEVKSVLSLTNASDIVAIVAGTGHELLVSEIPSTPAAWEELQKKLTANPIYLKNLVSADGQATALSITFLESINEDEFVRRGVDEKIQTLVDREKGPEQLYYTGLPHFKAYSARTMQQDLFTLLPLALLIIMGVLLACFRSWRGVLLPVLTVVVSLIWTLGLMVLCGSRLSLGSVMLPPLVLVVGTAYSLHVLAEYYEIATPGHPVPEVLLETLHSIAPPVLIAASTTFLGFFSQIVSPITSVRDMGIYSSVGIVIAALLSLILLPTILVLLPLPARRQEAFAPGLNAVLERLVRAEMRHRKAVIIGATIIALLAAWQVPMLQVGSNFLSAFPPQHPIRQAADAISKHLAGGMVFYVVIDGAEPGSMRQWDTVARLKDFQTYLDSLPGIDKTISFVDFCEMVDRGLQEIPPEEGEAVPLQPQLTFWENPAKLPDVLQMLFQAPTATASVVDGNFKRTNIRVRTSLSRPDDLAALAAQIMAYAQEHFPAADFSVHLTGNLMLYTRTASGLVSGEVQSLALTAGVIFVIMVTMFLSLRVGVIAMIPNLFPILVLFGLMSSTGVILSIATSTIASIALGLAVDDTIHIMARLSTEIRTTANQEEALVQCLGTVGKPTLYYSLLLFLGFLTLCFSTFVPVQEFGYLSAAAIVIGLAAEIVLLPALLATTPVITLWHLLTLKLGQDPHKTIPLFAGLRPLQAKIVTLMGELKSFPKGQPIVRQGDLGNEMYVVINGTADVLMHASEQSRKLGSLERGDVFGEMGLLRHHERMADVIATQDVEVLAVNERFLARLKRRYPRIATEIFFNISKILSDRLEAAQQRKA